MSQPPTRLVAADVGGALRSALRRGPALGSVARPKNARGTLLRLVRYFAEYRSRLSFVALCIVACTTLALLGPYLLGVALDRYIGANDAAGSLPIALLLLALFSLHHVLEASAGWLMAGISQSGVHTLRRALFQQLSRLPIAFFARNRAGELLSRLSGDVEAIQQGIAQSAVSLAAGLLSVVGIVIAMFALDVRLASLALLLLPSSLWLTRYVAQFTRRRFRALQQQTGQLSGFMDEAISGQKTVLTFGRGESVVRAFEVHNERVCRAGIAANTYALLLMPMTTVLGHLFVIALAGLGGLLALDGLVSVGLVASFVYYGQNLVQPLRQLSAQYNQLQAALAAAERVFDILDESPEHDAPSTSAPARVRGHVRFERVSFAYRPGTPVICDLTLEAKPGQMVALVGATGAGKSTIAQLLTRFYEVDRGSITIDGIAICALPKSELRRMVGLVLQETHLFGTSVLENIRYGRLEASDEEVMAVARAVGADAFIQKLAHGYRTRLSERGENLSQGERQLLSIARTLLAAPPILLLDEATSSLDLHSERLVRRALSELRRGRTSFVIAHRLSTIREADQLLVIDGGRVLERGTHEQLLARDGAYRRLYVSQFGAATLVAERLRS